MINEENPQLKANESALTNPRPGDYWHERFSPYFIVVNVKGSDFTVLSCLGGRKDELCALIEVDNDHWAFDYSKEMTVDREWIRKAVRYESIDGFVADVSNTGKTQNTVTEWREYRFNLIKLQIQQLQQEWEEFTGWKYLKSEC